MFAPARTDYSITQKPLLDSLASLLRRTPREVVFVAGVGVSQDATRDILNCSSWKGLLLSGVKHVRAHFPTSFGDPSTLIGKIQSGEYSKMLEAADEIERLLADDEDHEDKHKNYRDWLANTIGALKAKNTELIDWLHQTGSILATTNYDDLLTRPGYATPTWLDADGFDAIITGSRKGVIHLHGHWKKPESVILSPRNYAKILAHSNAQETLRAWARLKTVVFIGCKGTLEDPNFKELMNWARTNLRGNSLRWYVLCIASDAKHYEGAGSPLTPLIYGHQHSELLPYLRRNFSPGGQVSRTSPSTKVAPSSMVALPSFVQILSRIVVGTVALATIALGTYGLTMAKKFLTPSMEAVENQVVESDPAIAVPLVGRPEITTTDFIQKLGETIRKPLQAENGKISGVVGMPSNFKFDARTSLLTGTPPKAGVIELTLVATNTAGDTRKTVKITVVEDEMKKPRVSVPTEVTFSDGQSIKTPITVQQGSAIQYEIRGRLPKGLTFDPTTGFTGTITSPAARVEAQICAHNDFGEQKFKVTFIRQAGPTHPDLISAPTASPVPTLARQKAKPTPAEAKATPGVFAKVFAQKSRMVAEVRTPSKAADRENSSERIRPFATPSRPASSSSVFAQVNSSTEQDDSVDEEDSTDEPSPRRSIPRLAPSRDRFSDSRRNSNWNYSNDRTETATRPIYTQTNYIESSEFGTIQQGPIYPQRPYPIYPPQQLCPPLQFIQIPQPQMYFRPVLVPPPIFIGTGFQ